MQSQSDQIIEERRKRIEENRKKVVRYNLLLSLFVVFIIVGLAGTIYYYNKLKRLNSELEASKIRELFINDSLKKTTIALQFSKDSLREAKATLAKQKAFNDSILIACYKTTSAKKSENVTTLVNKLTTSRDAAREFAREGYRKLKDNDLRGAMEVFNKSEKAYNGYRDSYDVWFLLWSNRTSLDNPATKKQLLEKIFNDYNSLRILTQADIR